MPILQTPLRESQYHARGSSIDEQLRECVDQLQHPELISAEALESFTLARDYIRGAGAGSADTSGAGEGSVTAEASTEAQAPTEAEASVASDVAFYPSREIFVVRDSSSFTCLATRVAPPIGVSDPQSEAEDDGYDYLALTCTAKPRPVLGVVQSARDASAYPLLLRQLANLCEFAHPPQLERYDREYFRGLLGNVPLVDLHLVLWESWNDPDAPIERTPISQLTRDLAELVKNIFGAEKSIPPILGDIVCLQMNPDRFDGRVRFDWRV